MVCMQYQCGIVTWMADIVREQVSLGGCHSIWQHDEMPWLCSQ